VIKNLPLVRVTRPRTAHPWAVNALDLNALIEEFEDHPTKAGYGLRSTLALDENVIESGWVPNPTQPCEPLAPLGFISGPALLQEVRGQRARAAPRNHI